MEGCTQRLPRATIRIRMIVWLLFWRLCKGLLRQARVPYLLQGKEDEIGDIAVGGLPLACVLLNITCISALQTQISENLPVEKHCIP